MQNLQFHEIELNDYRQYDGTVTIDLQNTGDTHINIIEGENGAGKSNLLNAVTLCFYGREEHGQSSSDNLDSLPMVNSNRMNKADDNEAVEGYIEITLGTDAPEFIFKRRFRTVKLPGGGYSDTVQDLELRRKTGADWKPVDHPNTALNEILPGHVHQYFLFDGEQLDAFFEEGYTERVRNAILDVSHIELLNRGIDHLETVKSDIESDAADLGGEAELLKNELDDAKGELQRLKSDRDELKSDIEDAKNEVSKVENKMRDSQDPEVQRKIERREHLENRINELDEEINELEVEAREQLIKAGYIAYNDDALEYTHKRFEELAGKGQLPPKIQEWFIDELMERGECICGEPLDEDHRVEHLQELRQEMSQIMVENIEGKAEIPHIRERGQEQIQELIKTRKKISGKEDKRQGFDEEIQDLANELKGYDVPEDVNIPKLEQQRQEIRERIQDMNQELGQLKGGIKQQERVVDKKRKEWEEEAEKDDRQQELLQRIRFAQTGLEEMQSIKEEILDQIRADTQANLNQYFNELIWKDEEYTIELGDDYSVSVYGPSDDNKIGSLSAGEKQVLALSFMSALTKISGFKAPIVIDTPLGRISGENKERIAKNLPHYLKDTQITFLMTDQEYNDDVQTYLAPSVDHEYVLDYRNESTEVNPR